MSRWWRRCRPHRWEPNPTADEFVCVKCGVVWASGTR